MREVGASLALHGVNLLKPAANLLKPDVMPRDACLVDEIPAIATAILILDVAAKASGALSAW